MIIFRFPSNFPKCKWKTTFYNGNKIRNIVVIVGYLLFLFFTICFARNQNFSKAMKKSLLSKFNTMIIYYPVRELKGRLINFHSLYLNDFFKIICDQWKKSGSDISCYLYRQTRYIFVYFFILVHSEARNRRCTIRNKKKKNLGQSYA